MKDQFSWRGEIRYFQQRSVPGWTDAVHILGLKYFLKEITSSASLVPTVKLISDGAQY